MKIFKMKKMPNNIQEVVEDPNDLASFPIVVEKEFPIEEVERKTLTPAVIFDSDNVYTFDGVEAISAEPYQTLFNVNSQILKNISNYLAPENAVASHLPVSNVMVSNIKMVFENFGITLENIYRVYVSRVNDIFWDDNTDVQTFELNFNHMNLEHEMLNKFCENYLRASDEDREKILQYSMADFVISYVNLIGTNVYNDTKAQLIEFFSNISLKINDEKYESPIAYVMSLIDNAFFKMMGDMTYECGVFLTRFTSVAPYIYSNNLYDK